MMKPLILACFLGAVGLGAGPVRAEGLPAVFQLKGVADDDVLNIRSDPDANAAILGSIKHFDLATEVLRLSDDGKWGLVGLREGNGWVSMRFLQHLPPEDPYALQRPLQCMGNEPFWDVLLHPRGSTYSTPDQPNTRIEVTSEQIAENGFQVQAEEGPTRTYHLNVVGQACFDSMSGREFGWNAILFIESPDGNQAMTGCCTLDSRF